ncbi:hypothetical protein ACUXZZ_02790 [Streptomyces graminifolii]|uniref:hypothetical protein n=1 Tax=Streptomyces graminifolii TaxID=1266771 RepID=UPI00405A0BFA
MVVHGRGHGSSVVAGQDLDELLANCALLLIADHETTTHFIGNATLALLQQAGETAEAEPGGS